MAMNSNLLFSFLIALLFASVSTESQDTSASEWFLCAANSDNEACRQKRSQPQVTPLQPLGESPTEALQFSSPVPKKKRKACSNRTCFHGACEGNKCVCEKGWRGAYCKRDINECRSKRLCSHICVNTDGGYACTCCDSYYLDVDLSTCVKENIVHDKISMKDQPKICQKINRREMPKKSNKKASKPSFDIPTGDKRRPSFDLPAGLKSSDAVAYKHRRRTTMGMSKSRRVLVSLLRDVRGISSGATSATKRILYLMKALQLNNNPSKPVSLRSLPDPCKRAKCRFHCIVTSYNRARCVCPRGYRSDFNKRCKDINECSLSHIQCPQHQSCHNTMGGYECRCIMGYQNIGNSNLTLCEDIDECETGDNLCDSVSQCINEPGYYRCICPEGYQGDGVNCTSSSGNSSPPLTPSLDSEIELIETDVPESKIERRRPRIYTVVNADSLPAKIPEPVFKHIARRRPTSRARWNRLRGRAEWQKRMKHRKIPL